MRSLKRYIANKVFTLINNPADVPQVGDLRPLREQKKITLQTAAEQLGVWPIKISRIERFLSRDYQFAHAYRDYLLAA